MPPVNSPVFCRAISRKAENARAPPIENRESRVRDHGCIHAWPAQRRGWRFPALADCRDEWVKRFPHTVWAEPSPADWTFGEDDDE